MDYKKIEELIKALSESNLTYLELIEGDTKILLKKEASKEYAVQEIQKKQDITNDINVIEPQPKRQVNASMEYEGEIMQAPIVGTVYLYPAPDSDAFVNVGEKVKKGQTICIIEAMKLMNEIQSEYDGIVEEVLVENLQMVEYGEPLFKIKIQE